MPVIPSAKLKIEATFLLQNVITNAKKKIIFLVHSKSIPILLCLKYITDTHTITRYNYLVYKYNIIIEVQTNALKCTGKDNSS